MDMDDHHSGMLSECPLFVYFFAIGQTTMLESWNVYTWLHPCQQRLSWVKKKTLHS